MNFLHAVAKAIYEKIRKPRQKNFFRQHEDPVKYSPDGNNPEVKK